ncbi:MAG: hypothetical protein LUC90_10825 [Lachnospiraceae bacterium]|nr:hypothetical protein [Lachnospiraceae bacterium]
MSNTIRKHGAALAAVILAAAFLLAVCLFDWSSINSYEAYNTTSTSYIRGLVTDITSETLEKDELDDALWLGKQVLSVRLLEGQNKGNTVLITNYLTKVHSIKVEQGSRIIVCADEPENASPYYTVFGYDRTLFLSGF